MQFESESKTVSLFRINRDEETYRITTQTEIESLLPSIDHLGLIRSPILKKANPSGFTIIAGHRRIAAAVASGWSEILATIMAPSTNDLQCILLAIADNSLERELNQIELSNAYTRLTKLVSKTEDMRHYAEVLKLPYNPDYYDKMMIIGRLSNIIQEGLLNGNIALPTALLLGKMNPVDAKLFSDLFKKLKFSLNKQRELVELVTEIAIREDISIKDVLVSKSIQETVSNPDLDPSHITRKIREYLRTRRFPNLANAEAQFSSMVSRLALKPGLSLIPPKNFEGSRFTLSVSFKESEDLETHQTAISDLLKKSAFRQYFRTR